MGFPDNYTDLPSAKKTNRYQATGNSWAVPVVRWLGARLLNEQKYDLGLDDTQLINCGIAKNVEEHSTYAPFGKNLILLFDGREINGTPIPEECIFGNMKDIVSADASEDIYISPVGCYGIVRRKIERNTKINVRLEQVLLAISSQMSAEEIEKRSRVQQRGKFSVQPVNEEESQETGKHTQKKDKTKLQSEFKEGQLTLFDLLNER